MATLQKTKLTFKKGQLIHLDEVMDIQAFVLPYAKAHKSEYLKTWTGDMSDEFKMNRTITVEITVRGI